MIKFFDCTTMIKKEQIVGDIPSSRAIYKEVLWLAWPSVLERMLVSLVGAIDTMMVGNIGYLAIAAIGITQQPILVVLATIFAINIAVLSLVARRCGEKDFEGAQSIIRQSIMLVSACAIVLSTIGYIFAEHFLLLMGATADIIDSATLYFKVVLVGLIFNALGLNINSALRGAGNTRVSMVSNVVANLVNLILNFILIEGRFGAPALGVLGAAIGTITGQFIAFLISLSALLKKGNPLQIKISDNWHINVSIMRNIISISSGAFIDQICMRLGFLLYVRLVTALGIVSYAAHQIGINFLTFNFSIAEGMGIAASSLAGRSLGAVRADLAIIYGKVCERIGIIISIILCLLFILNRGFLVSLFTSEADVLTIGQNIMIIGSFVGLLQIPTVILYSLLRGAGDTRFVARISFISIVLVRPIATFILCYPIGLGVYGAWIATVIDFAVRLVIAYHRFSKGDWTKIKI